MSCDGIEMFCPLMSRERFPPWQGLLRRPHGLVDILRGALDGLGEGLAGSGVHRLVLLAFASGLVPVIELTLSV